MDLTGKTAVVTGGNRCVCCWTKFCARLQSRLCLKTETQSHVAPSAGSDACSCGLTAASVSRPSARWRQQVCSARRMAPALAHSVHT